MLRILKTLEIIGFFNEFKEGALAIFYQRKFTREESDSYLDNYSKWKSL